MNNNNNNNVKKEGWRETITTVVYAVLIAMVIRSFLFAPFSIPSSSMYPTLLVGDFLFVSKYSYGFSKHSLPWSVPLIPGRIFESVPERGDVIVFKVPKDNTTDYIKRLIGLPGDTIQMKEGRLYINSKIVPRKRIEDYVIRERDGVERFAQYIEILPNGKEHLIIEIDDVHMNSDETKEFKVPEGYYFFMGDNRDNSYDSRFSDVGFVPKENLVGKARRLFLSYDSERSSLFAFWRWPETMRWGRFFDKVD